MGNKLMIAGVLLVVLPILFNVLLQFAMIWKESPEHRFIMLLISFSMFAGSVLVWLGLKRM